MMSNSPILAEYVVGLSGLLEPPPTTYRAGEADRPALPFDHVQIRQAEALLLQSRALEPDLVAQWREALNDFEKSVAELRLLAAATADLAIAERLARAADDPEMASATYKISTGGTEALILQALNQPELLLAPANLPPYRASGQEAMQLQAATSECLRFVHRRTVDATGDAITGLITMDAAILKEAAEALGADISEWLGRAATGPLKTAVDYVMAASHKIRALLGPRADELVREGMYEFIEEIGEGALVSQAIERFLNTNGIYQESRGWILDFTGDSAVLASVTDEVMALQGSFAGRAKIANAFVKGLAVAKLLKPLAVPPWGPLGVTAAYLSIVGYLLYSAHDHVDSDRYTFLDRVQGVRGTLKEGLHIPADLTLV